MTNLVSGRSFLWAYVFAILMVGVPALGFFGGDTTDRLRRFRSRRNHASSANGLNSNPSAQSPMDQLLLGEMTQNRNSSTHYTGIKNVLAFGAVGDGSTDDSKAFQTALDSLQQGETLLIPPGLYLVANLVLPEVNDVTLLGLCGGGSAGGCSTLQLFIGSSSSAYPSFLMASSTYANNYTWTGAPVTISKIGFQGPTSKDQKINSSTGPAGLILMSWSTTVEECSFSGFGVAGLMAAAVNQAGTPITHTTQVNNRYYRNQFFNNAGSGFSIKDPQRNKNTDYFLKDNFAYNNGGDGFNLDTSAGAYISGNHFYSNGNFDTTINIGSKALRFDHNYLEGPNGLYIMTMNPQGAVQIQGNIFEGRAVLVANDGNATVLSNGNSFVNECFDSTLRVPCMQLLGNRDHFLTVKSIGDNFYRKVGSSEFSSQLWDHNMDDESSLSENYKQEGSVRVLVPTLMPVQP